jgi:hypothetical protein
VGNRKLIVGNPWTPAAARVGVDVDVPSSALVPRAVSSTSRRHPRHQTRIGESSPALDETPPRRMLCSVASGVSKVGEAPGANNPVLAERSGSRVPIFLFDAM